MICAQFRMIVTRRPRYACQSIARLRSVAVRALIWTAQLADWVVRAAFELRPVYEALMANLKRSTELFMDEALAS